MVWGSRVASHRGVLNGLYHRCWCGPVLAVRVNEASAFNRRDSAQGTFSPIGVEVFAALSTSDPGLEVLWCIGHKSRLAVPEENLFASIWAREGVSYARST